MTKTPEGRASQISATGTSRPRPRPGHRLLWLFAGLAASPLPLALLAFQPASAQRRETIFDRVVHLEPATVTEIPATPRWEERLGLEGRRVSVGDAELWVEEEGEGLPLVLLHGGPGGTHHGFHPEFSQAKDFARVIYYDQRGCGLSDYVPGPHGYSLDQAVEDLEALRQALELDRFILVGFSYGGLLAQVYTTRYPERVAGLVLVGASPGISANVGSSREQEFISSEERTRIQEAGRELREMAPAQGWSARELLALRVYNYHLNGDWKRQHYYKPSPEKMAQIALYEWVQDDAFNAVVSQSTRSVNLDGAFATNPIPTLILEGEWDLTWGPEKRQALAGNHPNGRLVTFEHAAHSIFNEDTEAFFDTLRAFVQELGPVDPEALAAYRAYVVRQQEAWRASPHYRLRSANWGQAASEELAEAFRPEWLEELDTSTEFMRLGFALYDVGRYEEAREVFARHYDHGRQRGDESVMGFASVWEGHMLDLLGRREEAVARYREAVELGREDTISHSQYGLRYVTSAYAAERLLTPFRRIPNRER